jgi:oligopeptide/dipeptide ABC transporter ATP-binding protein
VSDDAIIVQGLTKAYPGRRGQAPVIAVDDVGFRVPRGRTLGLVGESGSGKSTIARLVMGLIPADAGEVQILGECFSALSAAEVRRRRADLQIVFQEPYESLDPRMRIGDAIAEPLILHRSMTAEERVARVDELLRMVSLDPELRSRRPHQLSGGQQQRVNIARALATDPQVLVLDEPTSSLDVSVRVGILQLLVSLQERLGLTYLLISHDLPTVRRVCDEVAVMYLGRIVEIGPTATILGDPRHPYTEYLLASELGVDPREPLPPFAVRDGGQAGRPTQGCLFTDRCPISVDSCRSQTQHLRPIGPGHSAACAVRASG